MDYYEERKDVLNVLKWSAARWRTGYVTDKSIAKTIQSSLFKNYWEFQDPASEH